MGKTMRTLIALLALTGCVHAQTYKTVTADTNNVIRTNFSLVRSQVSDLSGASFAISNITGLQTALDGKLAANGSASALTNFPALLLTTNSSESAFPAALLRTNSAVSAFPSGLLRTNGDGSGLTNLPNANLSNAIGILPVSNGGSGATNAEGARTNVGLVWSGLTNSDASGFRAALSLGSAATNDASAFQPASANLTNLANNNGGSLTNVSVDLTTVLPSYSGNDGKVLAVATGGTNVAWTALSNTVTDASTLTNFPASILQTNSSDASFPEFLLRTNGSAAGLTSFPTFNQNTTGTASNVTGIVAIANGGSGANNVTNARINLLPSYSGNTNRVLAVNAGGTDVEWVVQTGGTATIDLSTTNATGILPLTKGGTGATNAALALSNLTVLPGNSRVTIGSSLSGSATNTVMIGTVLSATANKAVAIGTTADATGAGSIGIGDNADATNANAVSIGTDARAGGSRSVSLGQDAQALGFNTAALGSQAIVGASATNSVQLSVGNNQTANTVQFLSAGVVDTNEWSALATLSTQGRYAMTNTAGISGSKTFVAYDGTNYTTNTVTFSNGIITGWTP